MTGNFSGREQKFTHPHAVLKVSVLSFSHLDDPELAKISKVLRSCEVLIPQLPF